MAGFWTRSFVITNLEQETCPDVSAWLVNRGISHQFDAGNKTFASVKFNEASTRQFRQDFPSARVEKGLLEITIGW